MIEVALFEEVETGMEKGDNVTTGKYKFRRCKYSIAT